MSGIGKVFVVLNLVFSLVIVGAAATYLSHADNWKEQHKDVSDKFASEKEVWEQTESDLTTERDELRNQVGVKQNTIDDLKIQVSDLDSQLKSEQVNGQQLRDDVTGIKASISKVQSTINDLTSRNNELTDSNATLRTQTQDAIDAQRKAEDNLIRVQGDLATCQEQVASLEERVTGLDQEKEHMSNIIEVAKQQGFDITAIEAMPEIAAYVEEVDNDLGFVILSVGSDDKVKKGYKFHVYRGSSYLGDVVVDDVYPDKCAARIEFRVDGAQFNVNDKATTIL